jgi:hypothetical protein
MEVEIDWMQAMQDWRKRQGVTRSKIKLTDAANAAGFLGFPGSSPSADWRAGSPPASASASTLQSGGSATTTLVLQVLRVLYSMYSTRRTTNCKLEFLRGGVTL